MLKLLNMKVITTLAIVLAIPFCHFAQEPFTLLPQNFTNIYLGAAVWADYNRDGYMDFYLTGWRSQGSSTSAPSSYLYRNNGNGTFTEVATSVVPLGASTAAWGDFNNDGYPDLAVAGNAGGSTYDSRIYQNNGNGTFTDIQAELAPLLSPALAWGDLNNDGLPELVASGTASDGTAFTAIYLNNGDNTFTAQTAGLPQLTQSAVFIADMNLDGTNDILLCGRLGTSNYISRLYLNEGNGSFVLAFSFEPARYPAIDVTDVDSDGLPDVVVQGGNNTDVLHTSLYRNLGGGNFQLITNPFTGVYQGWAAFGDYNNDGLSDLAITGSNVSTGATRITKLFSNQGNGLFTEVTQAVFPALRRSMVQWGDMNNDGKLELLLVGYFNPSNYMTRIYINNTSVVNTSPSAPSGLQTVISSNNDVLFSWLASTDAQTAQASLTYNLRVGAVPGGNDVIAAHALPNGKLTIPRNGNQGNALSSKLKNLPDGTYYWAVQAVDAGFMGSEFAPEQSFTIGSTATHEVSFMVTYQGQPVQDVLLETPAGSVTTNAQGVALFILPEGNHLWFASKDMFRQAFGQVSVNAPTQIQVAMQLAAVQQLPLGEQFNNTTQPEGWKNQTQNTQFNRWAFDGSAAMAGSGLAQGNPVHAWLSSPMVLTNGLIGNLKLSFSHRLNINGTGAVARVYVFKETQSLPVWELLAAYSTGTGGSGGFTDMELPVSIGASATSVTLRFEFEETSTSIGLWEIDQLQLAYQPIAPHEVQIVSAHPAPNIQSPWFWFYLGSFTPSATIRNIGLQPINNLSLEIKYNGTVIGQSAATNLAPGQTATLTSASSFAPPAGPGTYALDYRTIAQGIDLTSPNNMATYLLKLTDSTYAQDYGTAATQLSVAGDSEFGHIFNIDGSRVATINASSIGINWGTYTSDATFRFRIYRLAANSNIIESLEYQSPILQVSAADAGHYRIYPLENYHWLEYGRRYALTLHSGSTLHLMADGLNTEGYHSLNGNVLNTVASTLGAPILRMNAQLVGGLETINPGQLSVYPNPAKAAFRPKNLKDETRADIYNPAGQLLMQVIVEKETGVINLSPLKPGLYVIRLPKSGRSAMVTLVP